jgi:hypothetical protein
VNLQLVYDSRFPSDFIIIIIRILWWEIVNLWWIFNFYEIKIEIKNIFWQKWVSIINFSWNFADISLLTCAYGKLRKTWTVAYDIIFLFLADVVFGTCSLACTIWAFSLTTFTMINCTLRIVLMTDFQFTAYFLLWFLKLFLRGCLLTAAGWIWSLIAWMIMLTWCVLLIIKSIITAWFLLRFLMDATFLHLVLVTVFVLIQPILKGLISLLLIKSNSIFIKKIFYFTFGFAIISNCPRSMPLIFIFIISNLFLEFYLLLFVDFFLINVFLVVLRLSFQWVACLNQ